jgi:hypothetical protein
MDIYFKSASKYGILARYLKIAKKPDDIRVWL